MQKVKKLLIIESDMIEIFNVFLHHWSDYVICHFTGLMEEFEETYAIIPHYGSPPQQWWTYVGNLDL